MEIRVIAIQGHAVCTCREIIRSKRDSILTLALVKVLCLNITCQFIYFRIIASNSQAVDGLRKKLTNPAELSINFESPVLNEITHCERIENTKVCEKRECVEIFCDQSCFNLDHGHLI